MKVFELAKELGVGSNDIVDKLKEAKYDVKNHMTVLTDEMINFVKEIYTTTADTSEPIEKEKITIKTETQVKKKEPIKKVKKDSDYKLDEMIPCRSVFAGVLLFTGDHTGMTYTFNGMGDRRNIEYQDLKAGMLQQKPSMFEPKFVIEDMDLINDEHWTELKEVYESMYNDDEIKKILTVPTRNFREAFEKMPITAKQSIAAIVATQIENGTFESYNKAKIIDDILGTRLDLKMM